MKNGAIFTDNTGQQIIKDIEPDSYIEIFLYTIKDFLSWWYIEMPIRYLRTWVRLMVILNDQLSITLLISHFFLPWRRNTSFAGYFFGIIIKAIYLPIAITTFLICSTIYISFIIIWLFIPIGIIVALIKTITN